MHGDPRPQLEIIPCIERFGDHRLDASCPASVQEFISRESAGRIGRVAEGRNSGVPRNAEVFPIPFKTILDKTQ